MKIKPFGKNVWVKPNEQKQVLVSDSKTFCENGEIFAIGDEVKKLKVGDKVAYVIWGLNHSEIEGEKFYIVPEDDRFVLFTY
jgi:co-chaperonin GroES (HSP10)